MEYIPLWEDNIRLPNQERVYFLWRLKECYSEPGQHRPSYFFTIHPYQVICSLHPFGENDLFLLYRMR